MKRKLSALLAVVLAVVMVFPTAIFVGADTTTPTDAIQATVTGHIDNRGIVEKGDLELSESNKKFMIPIDGEATITVEAPEGYFFDGAPQWTAGGAASVNGSLSEDKTTGTYTVTGTSENKDTLTFSATKPKKGSTPAVTIYLAIEVDVKKPVILADQITIELTRTSSMNNDSASTENARNDIGLDPYDTLTVKSVKVPLNNGKEL